jgi:hypothetical protein
LYTEIERKQILLEGKRKYKKKKGLTVGETHVQDECSTSGLRYDCGITGKD